MLAWPWLERPLLFAHRGAQVEEPENSLEAFGAGLAAGADVLEMDVHASADGEIVVAHDDHGGLTAGVARNSDEHGRFRDAFVTPRCQLSHSRAAHRWDGSAAVGRRPSATHFMRAVADNLAQSWQACADADPAGC
jgi:glycerophosphoryl diester phosphodiesterase